MAPLDVKQLLGVAQALKLKRQASTSRPHRRTYHPPECITSTETPKLRAVMIDAFTPHGGSISLVQASPFHVTSFDNSAPQPRNGACRLYSTCQRVSIILWPLLSAGGDIANPCRHWTCPHGRTYPLRSASIQTVTLVNRHRLRLTRHT